MAHPQLNFSNIYKSQNGVRPKAQCNQFVTNLNAGQQIDITFWMTIGLTSTSSYIDDTDGSEGTKYPANGATHIDSDWRDVGYTSSQYTKDLPRVPASVAGFSTGLSANTSYTVTLWMKHNMSGETELINYVKIRQVVVTPSADDVTWSNASSEFNGGSITTTQKVNTNGVSVILKLQYKPLNNDFSTGSTLVDLTGGIAIVNNGNYPYVGNYQATPKQNLTYWRYQAINAVTGVTSNSPTQPDVSCRPPNLVELEEATSITSNAYTIKAKTTPLEMGAGTLEIQHSTSSNMSGASVVGSAEAITTAEGSSGEEQTTEQTKTGLTQDTTYYVRAKLTQTAISSVGESIKYSDIKAVRTGVSRKAVKTPGEYGVGYFFKGNFSAYRKLRQQDKPDFTPSWKTSAVINGTAYLGNVKYKDKFGITHKKPDRILKSLPGAVDTFTKYNYIDVATEDGDDITALASIGERLIQFKKNSMYVINVGGDFDFLESSYKGIGVQGPYAVCEFPQVIAYVNQQGAYVFNGQQIVNLLERDGVHIIKKEEWSSFASVYAMIGYIQEKNMFIVVDDCSSTSSGNAYLFDIDSGGWIYYKGGLPSGQKTNLIYDNGGRMLFANGDAGEYYYPQVKSGGNDEFVWQSGQLDFGDPTSMQKVYEVTISYENSGMQSQPLLYWSGDGGKTWESPENGSFYNHPENSGWHNATFKLKSSDPAQYVYPTVQSLMLKLETANIAEGYTNFKLNEINIEYRVINKRLTADDANTSTVTTGITDDYASGGSQGPTTVASLSSN